MKTKNNKQSDVSEALGSFLKNRVKDDTKKGVDLTSIAQKLSEKKFGKRR